MGFQHNFMSHQASLALLREIRTATAQWSHPRLTPDTTIWQGMAEWPRPDIAFEDRRTNASMALEFKPPNQTKREYITGLGQALTYLNDFEFSGLVVPERADDDFKIGEYLEGMVAKLMDAMPMALFTYTKDPSELLCIRKLRDRAVPLAGVPSGIGRNVFWGYWRDLSNHDLVSLMKISDAPNSPSFDATFKKFWLTLAVPGYAQTWEGKRRKAKAKNSPSFEGEKLNARLAMWHAGLLSKDGRLTGDGHELLRIGKIYGADSVAFKARLARQVLVSGQHIELILWVEEKQRLLNPTQMTTASKYMHGLDGMLVMDGVIAPRLSGAAKPNYLRDEPKLWNKLGLLIHQSRGKYFFPGRGFAFDWRRIISVMDATA